MGENTRTLPTADADLKDPHSALSFVPKISGAGEHLLTCGHPRSFDTSPNHKAFLFTSSRMPVRSFSNVLSLSLRKTQKGHGETG